VTVSVRLFSSRIAHGADGSSETLPKLKFSLPDGHCYLNGAFMGLLPRLVEQAGVDEGKL
jgi:hypothetical protein